MEEFNLHDSGDLKQAWQAIIKNTSVLDDETRSKVYSKLQSIRCYSLDCEDAKRMNFGLGTVGRYNPHVNCLYMLNDGSERLPSTLVHELLHGVSNNYKGIDGFYFASRYKVESEDKCTLNGVFHGNKTLSEGVTEFLACEFLGMKNTKTAYYDFVNIVKYMASAIGYKKLMTYYFNNDIEGFLSNVQEAFHLKDQYLIDKLFYYMDKEDDELSKFSSYYDSTLAQRCQELLLEMEMNRVLFEHKDEIKTNKDIFSFINLEEFYKKLNSGWGEIRNKDVVYNKARMLDEFLRTGDYRDKAENLLYLVFATHKNLIDYNTIKKIPSNYITMLTDLYNKDLLFSLPDQETPLDFNMSLFSSFMNKLHDQNGKIDLSNYSKVDKFDFMTNVLYNPYDKNYFEHFYPKDLVWYISENNNVIKSRLNTTDFSKYMNDYAKEHNDFESNKGFLKLLHDLKTSKSVSDVEIKVEVLEK